MKPHPTGSACSAYARSVAVHLRAILIIQYGTAIAAMAADGADGENGSQAASAGLNNCRRTVHNKKTRVLTGKAGTGQILGVCRAARPHRPAATPGAPPGVQ